MSTKSPTTAGVGRSRPPMRFAFHTRFVSLTSPLPLPQQLALCYVWFSFGIYSDREFGGLHFFRKHRLALRFFFYSPHGESDKPETTDSERSAEHDYTEFVEFKHGRERSWTILQ